MGSYRKRTVPSDLRNIAWAKEGEWIKSLGVPIGNDLDHALLQYGKRKPRPLETKRTDGRACAAVATLAATS